MLFQAFSIAANVIYRLLVKSRSRRKRRRLKRSSITIFNFAHRNGTLSSHNFKNPFFGPERFMPTLAVFRIQRRARKNFFVQNVNETLTHVHLCLNMHDKVYMQVAEHVFVPLEKLGESFFKLDSPPCLELKI